MLTLLNTVASFITSHQFVIPGALILANGINAIIYTLLSAQRNPDGTVGRNLWACMNICVLIASLVLLFYGLTFYDGAKKATLMAEHAMMPRASADASHDTLVSLSLFYLLLSLFLVLTTFVRDAKLTASEFSSDFGSFMGCLLLSPFLTAKTFLTFGSGKQR